MTTDGDRDRMLDDLLKGPLGERLRAEREEARKEALAKVADERRRLAELAADADAQKAQAYETLDQIESELAPLLCRRLLATSAIALADEEAHRIRRGEPERRIRWLAELRGFDPPAARELEAWLRSELRRLEDGMVDRLSNAGRDAAALLRASLVRLDDARLAEGEGIDLPAWAARTRSEVGARLAELLAEALATQRTREEARRQQQQAAAAHAGNGNGKANGDGGGR